MRKKRCLHYILHGHEPEPCMNFLAWCMWFETADRRVERTDITDEADVSTVFLGLDHQWGDGPPLLFETMVFGGEHDQWQDRYSTWDQAQAGHDRVVAALRNGTDPEESRDALKGAQ